MPISDNEDQHERNVGPGRTRWLGLPVSVLAAVHQYCVGSSVVTRPVWL